MFTDSILIKLLIGAAYGIFLGVVTIIVSKKLTLKRTDDPVKAAPIDTTLFKIMAVVVGIIASVAVMLTSTDTALAIRNELLLIPIASIAVVDSLVRKIPNPLLLYMIIVQVIYLVYYSVTNDPQILLAAGFGFFVGFASCAFTTLLKVPVGNGDTKYCAVLGMCIYLQSFLQSMVLVGLIAIICLIYLKATKKGGLKTMIPLGPLISLATVISICFPYLPNFLADMVSQVEI